MKVKRCRFVDVAFMCPFSTVEQISRKSKPAMTEDSTGEMNHDATVIPNLPQLSVEAYNPARPAPISAPITVCVPLIGIPKIDETKMKLNEARQTPSINRSCTSMDCSSSVGRSLFAKVPATF